MPTIGPETPDQDEIRALFAASDAVSADLYPAESNHPVYADTLSGPAARFFVARTGGRAIGCAGLVIGRDGQAELKRMYVDPAARGTGLGAALLRTVEGAGRDEGVRIVQLETGIHSHAALRLYRRFGYREREPFGSYRPDPLSVFMEKLLAMR